MSSISPASILYDEAGNPVGVVQDGLFYRLRVEARMVESVENHSELQDGQLGVVPLHRGTGGWSSPDERLYAPAADELVVPQVDGDGQHIIRGRVHTDEGMFQDDFPSGLEEALTGDVTFTSGSDVVTGSGTLFTTELTKDNFIRLSSHDQKYARGVYEIRSDTKLVLSDTYTGGTGTGEGTSSRWRFWPGSGASITQNDSSLDVHSGTTAGAFTHVIRDGDYVPLEFEAVFRVSNRSADQTIGIGLRDCTGDAEALILLTGDRPRMVSFRTGSRGETSHTTDHELPSNLSTEAYHRYRIMATAESVVAWVDGDLIGEHRYHTPDPYVVMGFGVFVRNNVELIQESVVYVDSVFVSSFNLVSTRVVGNVTATLVNQYGKALATDTIDEQTRLRTTAVVDAESPGMVLQAGMLRRILSELNRIRVLLELLTDERAEESSVDLDQ